MRANTDNPANIEVLLRTHRDVVTLTDTIADLMARFAKSCECSANFVKMAAQLNPLRRRLIYAAHYDWFHGVAFTECVQNENDDDEMEVVFDIVDKYTWTLWNETLAEEIQEIGLAPGTELIMETRYLWGVFGICADFEDPTEIPDDIFIQYPFEVFLPNQKHGYLPEVAMYKFLGRSKKMIEKAHKFKLTRFYNA